MRTPSSRYRPLPRPPVFDFLTDNERFRPRSSPDSSTSTEVSSNNVGNSSNNSTSVNRNNPTVGKLSVQSTLLFNIFIYMHHIIHHIITFFSLYMIR